MHAKSGSAGKGSAAAWTVHTHLTTPGEPGFSFRAKPSRDVMPTPSAHTFKSTKHYYGFHAKNRPFSHIRLHSSSRHKQEEQ
jgi:hypothetical protein